MNCTLGRALLALCVTTACGPSPPADSTAAATEPAASSTTSPTTPTTTMPPTDMGVDDPICPTLPPLPIRDCVPPTDCPETTVHTGDIEITKAEDIAALACVHELRGRLDVFDENIKTLVGLERLARVRGSIRITTTSNLTDLAGLCGLTAIDPAMDGSGGDLEIDFNFGLSDLAGLARLEHVAGELTIRDNSALVSLRGLASLTSLGDLFVWDNDALESLRGLDRLDTGTEFTIYGNNKLVDLCGLHGLTVVDSLSVVANDGLQTLWGAHHLQRANIEVHIGSNDGLTDLTGLQKLSDVPRLQIRGNAALQSLAGLDALADVGTLSINDNDALLDWEAPKNLLVVHHLDICGNDNLTTLSATNLTVDRLTVTYNDILGDAAGQSYAAALAVSTPKIANNSLPPYTLFSPCPWSGDGICDEEDACYEWSCVLCSHDDCCGDSMPTAICAQDTDAPKDCPGPH